MNLTKKVRPEEIIVTLESFNRKERFHLLSNATGDNGFKLCDEFIGRINNRFDIHIPENNFVAMDYHMDWIKAALTIVFESAEYPNGIYPNGSGKGRLNENQEDVDLLIGYCDKEKCHLIMLEAKAATGWTNKQLKSKAAKQEAIFYVSKVMIYPNVILHFALISPQKPKNLDMTYSWPSYWLDKEDDINWLKLEMPDNQQRIVKCDENGRITEESNYWQVKKVKYLGYSFKHAKR